MQEVAASTIRKGVPYMSEMNKEVQQQPISFDAIKIGLASPEQILKWSKGEVTKPETINYRTLSLNAMVCTVKEFSDLARTGSVTVVNIKRSDIKVLSVTVVV